MQLDHVNMSVADLATSVDWYGRVFGFAVVERGVWRDIPWAIVQSDGAVLALYEHPGRTVPDASALARAGHLAVSHVGLRITDEQAWLATIAREGVHVDHTADYPRSRSWYVVDPSGWEIEVALWNEGTPRF